MPSELASLIEANTRIDGCSFPTSIPSLHLSRYSSPTQPGQGAQCPTLAIVAQGSKQIMLGDEAFNGTIGWSCQRCRESRHLVKENFDKPFSIKLIAQETNMSPSGLHHHFNLRA
jgi:hypothetical protein